MDESTINHFTSHVRLVKSASIEVCLNFAANHVNVKVMKYNFLRQQSAKLVKSVHVRTNIRRNCFNAVMQNIVD